MIQAMTETQRHLIKIIGRRLRLARSVECDYNAELRNLEIYCNSFLDRPYHRDPVPTLGIIDIENNDDDLNSGVRAEDNSE